MHTQIKTANGIALIPLETRHLAKRRVLIKGKIDMEAACEFADKIMLLNDESREEPIDVYITSGGGEMLYGRKGEEIKRMKPFRVEVRSTLGAGDTYKAGCTYALLHGMPDDELVRFASACSGVAISRFPLPLNPPTLDEVHALLLQA